ncbi:hypothetical protein Cpir12675_005710 [Ceratocystis pirilliformis]|uniref:Uncharacterized protein n=1 Tax=Ceratocystis pirilliformis TaxID=259994 RepID=A0ABR3YNC2_9PEZI
MLPDYGKKKSMVEAIGVLLSYGLLREQKTPKIFDMHNLVHLTTQTQLWRKGLEDEAKYMLAVADHMASIFPTDEWENQFLWRQYLSHALRVVKNEKASGESMAQLEFRVGQCFKSDGNDRNAVKLLEHVAKTGEEALEADHPGRLASQYALAQAYRADDQPHAAIKLLQHVVELNKISLTRNLNWLQAQELLEQWLTRQSDISRCIELR